MIDGQACGTAIRAVFQVHTYRTRDGLRVIKVAYTIN
jgi:hypothetical protein